MVAVGGDESSSAALNRVRWCPKHTTSGSEHQFEGPTYMKGEPHTQGHKIATVSKAKPMPTNLYRQAAAAAAVSLPPRVCFTL